MDAWYGSLPPEGVFPPIEAWVWTWGIGSNPPQRVRYTGALNAEWFEPDALSGVHVSDEADLASVTAGALERAGLASEISERLAPYCGLVGVQAVQALRRAPLRLSDDEAAAVEAAWRTCNGR